MVKEKEERRERPAAVDGGYVREGAAEREREWRRITHLVVVVAVGSSS